MKKTIFLWTFLAIAGVSSVNAQMRISGSDAPNKSAILDLNPDNEISKGNATLGVALPRVMLKNTHDASPLETHVPGMTVYNVASTGDVTPGIYISNGVQWIRQIDTGSTELVVQKDSIIGNEVTDVTAGGGLIRAGAGTKVSPYTLGVASGGITTDKLADGSVTINKFTKKTIIELGDSIAYYISQNFNSTELGDTIMQYLTNNLDNSALMDSIANYVRNNNSYLTALIENIAQNVYNTTLGDTIVDYISNNIANTEFGDSIANYIANNIHNTVLEDAFINLIHDNELDGIIGNEVTNATTNGGLIRSGAGTTASPYTLGITNGGVTTAHFADNSITSSKIVNGTIAAADLGQMGASNGQVMKWNGTTWSPTADAEGLTAETDGVIGNEVTNATSGGGLTRSGLGTTASPYTLGIAAGGVTSSHLADNSITSAKIVNGTIDAADIGQMGALNGQVLTWNGTAWQPAALAVEVDGIVGNEVTHATTNGGLTRSGSGTAAAPYTLGISTGGVTSTHLADNAITSAKIADGTITSADIATGAVTSEQILNGTIKAEDLNSMGATSGQSLVYNSGAWAPATTWATPVTILNGGIVNDNIISGSYNDAYSWTGLEPGLYSLRLRVGNSTVKFILQSSVAFGTSIQFEVNANSGDSTAEVMFNYYYTGGSLNLKAQCTGGCPARISNLYLARF